MKTTFLALLPLAAIAMAAPGGSFTIGQVMSAPFASAPLAAPSGARVAWLENEEGKRNIWVAEGPGWKGRKITNFNRDDGQEIAELAWAPDGSYLLFARGGDFENGGDNPNPDWSPTKPEQEIWYVALGQAEGGQPEAKRLTEGHAPVISPRGDTVAFLRAGQIFLMKPTGGDVKNAVTQKGTAGELTWSPDGSTLAFVSARRGHSFIGLYSQSGNSLRFLDASVDNDTSPVWSPDGRHLAYLRIPTGGPVFGPGPQREAEPWSIRVAEAKSGEARQVFRAAAGPGSVFHDIVADRQLFWAADDRLVFPWERTGWLHLYSVRLSGGAIVELTPGEGEVEHVAISHDAKTMYFSANLLDIDRRHLWSVSARGGDAPKQLTSGQEIEWNPQPLADGSALAFLASSYNQRAHAAVAMPEGKITRLSPEALASFPADALVKPQAVTITAADGLEIHGQLFLPPPNGTTRHPALLFFHGGSRRQMLLGFHYMYYYSNAYSLNQYLASRGYIVLSVNYRSGIGYGLNFREALNYGAQGGSEYKDVIGAGLYMKSRPDVDPERIGIWGGSYGGYLTAMALSRASDLFKAGVDFHGVHDWSAWRDYPAIAEGDPRQREERLEALRLAFDSSPMSSIDGWRSPVLLIHGDDDRNVSFSQTLMLAEALRKRHVPFEELIFPNEIHDFLRHEHWVQAYEASADFFARKLSPQAAGESR
jgi:dipeptidyl aminopeptidase/acylaminoacyl peptidase